MTGDASNGPDQGSATADFWEVYRANEGAIVQNALRSCEGGATGQCSTKALDAFRLLGREAIPYLVRAYHTEPGRLSAALTVLQRHVERVTDDYQETGRRELFVENRLLREAGRIKSEFLASMNHELRTPLTSIIGFSELMAQEKVGAISEAHREYLGDILTSSKHLLHLINNLVDLAKLDAGKVELRPEHVELSDVVSEVCTLLRGLSSTRRVCVETFIDGAVARVFLDPNKLKQILYNYLTNAIKFTEGGGSVTLRAMPAPGARLRVEVMDTGIGIRQEYLSDLFAGQGYISAGFGLLLTKRLAEAQGGEVGVKSVFGQGSVFWVVLPAGVPV